MNLSAPKQMTFIVAVVLAVIGLLAAIIPLGFLSGLSFWLVLVGFILLAAGCFVPNL
jgi:heme/copper-type cytochrome/quinol oxidase subunit 1